MRRSPLILTSLVILCLAGLTAPARAQYREYYISGKVVDTQKQPVDGAVIELRDVNTSRSYTIETNKKGEFKLVGLPHGVYKVTITKEGFAVKTDEWKFESPQEKMVKVEVPEVTLVAQSVIAKAEELKEAEAEIKEAARLLQQGDVDGAEAILSETLAKNPKDANALYLMGICRIKKKDYAAAVASLTEVTKENPNFPGAYIQLGICYQDQGDREKALEYYQKAMDLDPESPDVLYDNGLMLFELNRIPEALPLFEKALSFRPDDPAILEMAGRCYINQADYPKAVEYLEKAKALYTDPDKIKFLDDLIAKIKELIKDPGRAEG
jgi:tetratricopeptide (TPR) repeat protein